MKFTKYFLIGAMMIGFCAPVAAQDDAAVVDQATQIIKSKPADFEDQMKAIYKKNRKKADVMVGIGKAFLAEKDTANAKAYCQYALKADSKYAAAFLLLGDIESEIGNGGEAAKQYEQAIYFDPKNPEAYYKYASVYRKVSPAGAIQKLEDLRIQRPDVAVDALIGHIHYLDNNWNEAISSFGKASSLNEKDLTEYAMACYFAQKYEKSLEIVKQGLAKAPRDAAFNRLALFSYTELKDYQNAITYAKKLFNESDEPKFSYLDYVYYGNALNGAKQGAEAIEMYKKALEQDIDNKDKRAGVYKQMSDAYKQANDYKNAIASYKDYQSNLSKSSVSDLADLGRIYLEYASDTAIVKDQAEKVSILKEAESVYAEMEKDADAKEYALLYRARVNTMIDPESDQGLAKPFYEQLMQTIEAKAEKDKADQARVIECYRYMAAFSWLKEDNEEAALNFYNKILALSPNDPQATQAAEVLTKRLKK